MVSCSQSFRIQDRTNQISLENVTNHILKFESSIHTSFQQSGITITKQSITYTQSNLACLRKTFPSLHMLHCTPFMTRKSMLHTTVKVELIHHNCHTSHWSKSKPLQPVQESFFELFFNLFEEMRMTRWKQWLMKLR